MSMWYARVRAIMRDMRDVVAFRPDVLLENADRLVTYAYVTSSHPLDYEHLPVFLLRAMAQVAQSGYLLQQEQLQ